MERSHYSIDIHTHFGTREEYEKFCERWNKATSILRKAYKELNENTKDRMQRQNRAASGRIFNGGN